MFLPPPEGYTPASPSVHDPLKFFWVDLDSPRKKFLATLLTSICALNFRGKSRYNYQKFHLLSAAYILKFTVIAYMLTYCIFL